jgi:hypothetical protein
MPRRRRRRREETTRHEARSRASVRQKTETNRDKTEARRTDTHRRPPWEPPSAAVARADFAVRVPTSRFGSGIHKTVERVYTR